ncbi:MAG: hypothetical protein ABDH49_08875 [Candidatus Hydrothermales bacterium]
MEPPFTPTKPTTTPSVPEPGFTSSPTILNPNQAPDTTVDEYVSLASEISNSVVTIFSTISDSLKFNFSFESSSKSSNQIKTFGTEGRYVFTWDTLGLKYTLILILDQNSIIESLFVHGTYRDTVGNRVYEINLNNYLFLDLAFKYITTDGDTFGDGVINFYSNKDTLDKDWDNSEICFNLFFTFYVREDTVNLSYFVDTLHRKGERHDKDFNIFEIFGAKKTNFVHAGVSAYQWILYHVKDYLDNRWDEVDYVYNPGFEPTTLLSKFFFPKNVYKIIPKTKKVLKIIRTQNKEINKMINCTGWYYVLRFEINPNYTRSRDTARIFYDEGEDNEYPTYPNGPFTVPPFDFGYNW